MIYLRKWGNSSQYRNIKAFIKGFNVTINTLLGAPKQLICQCCGMPLEDEIVGHDSDGSLNEDYCKWCYADGIYTYSNMDDLIDVCVKHLINEGFAEEQARSHMKATLPTLDYWKRYEEFNELHIDGMPKVEKLNALVGAYVNLAYPLPSGASVKFLNDQTTYLGNQLESEFGGNRCFGILANMDFIMVCTYEAEGAKPELLLYKKR